jgi:Zn-dependent protease with chaperone function
MMTDKQFAAIVSETDELARTQPARYQRKMWCLIVLGDLYLAAIAVLLLALQAGTLCIIVWDVGSPSWQTVLCIPVLIWAIWLTRKLMLMKGGRKPSVGIPLTRQQAPELFALIDTLCCQADAPPIRQVLITEAFNAGVEQLPRLGVFGWHQRKLLIGLPLLKCLTVEQCKAVLAHELGHLSIGGHGRMARRVYHQMLRWSELAEMLDADLRGFLFLPFLKWLVPYFAACSSPLARMNEYDADAASVRLVSLEAAAEALSVSNVIDKYLQEHYWPQVLRLADTQPEPVAPYLAMGRNLAADVDAAWISHWVTVDRAC